MTPAGEWEPDAENWLRWARTPFHDAYWYYRDAFFDSIVPPPARRCVELGCGEGRVARDLSARGHRVIAVDTSHTLLRYAHEADATTAYLRADTAALPFRDASFDLAVAYNSLQVVADMARTVGEAARLVVPGGHFCVCVTHPLSDVGRFVDDSPDAAFAIREDYFARRRVDDTVERDGLEMTFRGWTYSLEDYSLALERAGFRIETMREPRPSGDPARYSRWNRVPLFLLVRAVRE
jgi:SAM-dependent methyltransferase